MIPDDRAERLDTLHALILFLGLWGLLDYGIQQEWSILFGLGVLSAWTLGYWAFVKHVLPTRWSGQT